MITKEIIDRKSLIQEAKKARMASYMPYSHFAVGAALLGRSGKVYLGCNIENASYSPTNCAERTAFFKAVSEGEREFMAIAVVGGMAAETTVPGVYRVSDEDITEYCPPCGVCRQVMAEFCEADFKVILAGGGGRMKEYILGELLPETFAL